MYLHHRPSCNPRKLKTDKHEYWVYERDGIIKCFTRRIYLGEVICSKKPIWVMRVKDFMNYKNQYEMLLKYMEEFGSRL